MKGGVAMIISVRNGDGLMPRSATSGPPLEESQKSAPPPPYEPTLTGLGLVDDLLHTLGLI